MWTTTMVLWSARVPPWKQSHFLVHEWAALSWALFMETNRVSPWLVDSLGRRGLLRSQLHEKPRQNQKGWEAELPEWEASVLSFGQWLPHWKQTGPPWGDRSLLKSPFYLPIRPPLAALSPLSVLRSGVASTQERIISFPFLTQGSVNWFYSESLLRDNSALTSTYMK